MELTPALRLCTTAAFPPELERAERRGVLHGPFAYARSRWDDRLHRGGARSAAERRRVLRSIPRQADGRERPQMTPAQR